MDKAQAALQPEENEIQPRSGSGSSLNFLTSSADGRVRAGQDTEIFPDRPRPEFASFGTLAFEAKDKRASGMQIALVCDKSLCPRVTNIGSCRSFRNPYLLKMLDAGIVYWTPENRQAFAAVFEMPQGAKLMASLDAAPYKIPGDAIIQAIIRPIASVLADLNNLEIVHGAVMPDNIYITGGQGSETAILGEFISSAPFLRLPPLFETIERAMAQPSARGEGSIKNDLYALGVCTAIALRGEYPLRGKTSEEIIYEKIENGSYGVIVGRDKIPAALSEFFRGVLNDDEAERWGIEDVLSWLEGQHPNNKQMQITLKAARPFPFRGEKFWDTRSLAYAFGLQPAEAAAAIEKDQFDLWVKRNFEGKDIQKHIEKVWNKDISNTPEKMVTNTCLALDPKGPVRYKNIAVMPDGMGGALAEAIGRGGDIQPYAEIISHQLLSAWVQQQFSDLPEGALMISNFEKARSYLTQKLPGYGIERVLYAMNKEVVCMSPAFRDYFVFSPAHVLLALEALCKKGNRPETILDRHMMAFLSIREAKMIDPHLGKIVSRDKGDQLVGTVRALVAIQRRFKVDAVPSVGNWIISLSQPAIERYNDRDLRQEVQKRMNKLVDTGNLAGILELIDATGLAQDDTQRFIIARQEFAGLLNEAKYIAVRLKNKKSFGYDTGRQVAMVISSVLSFCCIMGFLILYFVGN